MLNKIFITILPALFIRLVFNTTSSSKNVFDKGSRSHAAGSVNGSNYTVADGDTFYSIGLRFNLPYQEILRANNLAEGASVPPGHRLIIPGLQATVPPVNPPVKPTPPVKPPSGIAFLSITSPTPGSTLNPRYTVIITGTGVNIRGNRVLVKIKDPRGITLRSQDLSVDSSGNWRAEFKDGVPAHPGSTGIIEAISPGSDLRATVNIHYQ